MAKPLSKMELLRKLETIETCAKEAWAHEKELAAKVDALYAAGNLEAALKAQIIWQSFNSALQMANLNQFSD